MEQHKVRTEPRRGVVMDGRRLSQDSVSSTSDGIRSQRLAETVMKEAKTLERRMEIQHEKY